VSVEVQSSRVFYAVMPFLSLGLPLRRRHRLVFGAIVGPAGGGHPCDAGFSDSDLYHPSTARRILKWTMFSVVGRSWVGKRDGHKFHFGSHREGKVDRAKYEEKRSDI
jgi:hypothetical protein